MYHELEVAGRPMGLDEPGYVRYVLAAERFEAQLQILVENGFTGLSVSEARAAGDRSDALAITFDDGCQTDLLEAAPRLASRGFGATFYLVAGFLGRPGFLTAAEARELARRGFEIGCHSMTHPNLDTLDSTGLGTEVVDSKALLEDVVGSPVVHFSCPGGRWSPEVARLAREAGYRTVSTSRVAPNLPGQDPYRLNRVAVMRNVPSDRFLAICQGRGLAQQRLAQSMRSTVRSLVGPSVYDRIRTALLGTGEN